MRVVEVGGDGDDGVFDGAAQVAFSGFLHFAEDKGTDLAGGVAFPTRFNPRVSIGVADNVEGNSFNVRLHAGVFELAANEAFRGKERVLRVHNGLALRWGSYKELALLGECDRGGGCSGALRVFNDTGRFAFHDGDTRIRGPQVDTNHAALDFFGGCRVEALFRSGIV